MLVLSRKVNECVVIGGNIEVFISRIEGDLVKLCLLYTSDAADEMD
jgi:carbon storage regulator